MRLNFGAHKWLWFDGYGRMTSSIAQHLIRAGHSVYPFELRELAERPAWYLRAQGLDFSHLTLQFAPPNQFVDLPGRSVTFTMHESMRLPMGWAEHINAKSQMVMVPHPWLVPVLADAGVKIPIEVVKSGIDPEECPVIMQNRQRPFTFGCLADRATRKGWDKVYSAFYKVFSFKNRDVRLILKCRPGSLASLDLSYSPDDRLTIWRADVRSIGDIYAQMDAFIAPVRCEGWGQTPREAAACGIPTVVTRFSGTDDETDQWALPLDDYTLVESDMPDCGGKWAEPSLDEVCEKMLWIYQHQDEAKQKALDGARWLRQNRTFAHTARNLVGAVNRHFGGGPPPDEPENWNVPAHSNGHRHEVVSL